MEEKVLYCQSCGMPMVKDEDFGKNPDGTKNMDYCCYCDLSEELTMDEMIERCVPFMLEGGAAKNEDEARAQMRAFFPMLKRWKKD